MESLLINMSILWDKFSVAGTKLVSDTAFAMTGLEIGNTASLAVFISMLVAAVVVSALVLRKPSDKSTFLMGSGQHYQRR